MHGVMAMSMVVESAVADFREGYSARPLSCFADWCVDAVCEVIGTEYPLHWCCFMASATASSDTSAYYAQLSVHFGAQSRPRCSGAQRYQEIYSITVVLCITLSVHCAAKPLLLAQWHRHPELLLSTGAV